MLSGFEISGGPVALGYQIFSRTTRTLGSSGPTGNKNFPAQNFLKELIMISLFKILFEIVVYSESILKIMTGPSAMKEDHYILVAGGPLGQCSRKLISNPGRFKAGPASTTLITSCLLGKVT